MELHVAPGGDGDFLLYEDDGETLRYRQGDYALTRFTMAWQPAEAVLTIHPVEGAEGLVPVRDWQIVLHGSRRGTEVQLNGEALPAVYDAETNTLTVALQEVRPERGVVLQLSHPDALTHDNSDCRSRILDRITRAQNSQREKAQLLENADRLLANAKAGRALKPWDTGVADQPSLGGYMAEMILQL